MTIIDKQSEFMSACSQNINRTTPSYNSDVRLWRNLVEEEFDELSDALYILSKEVVDGELDMSNEAIKDYHKDVVKEALDLLYVTSGLLNVLGIDPNKGFDLLHGNNMTKRADDGTVHKNSFGKVLKPEGYVPLDLEPLYDS